ncbi:MAG TPA: serine hydrolase [Cyclobacteriaceae bacterium]|nr:serine hydrolase [Cyclobacteriaceae bacterium]
MKQNSDQFNDIIKNPALYEVQIIYTQINRDANNQPHFKTFYFNTDSNRYFYPASTVKLPAVMLALEKLNDLNVAGLDKYTTMLSDSVYSGQQSVLKDSTAATGLPSIAHYARKILVVSDNDAFNRLYELIGQKEFNEKLADKGYSARILHRLQRFLTPDQNRHSERIRFVHGDSIIYEQPMLINQDSISPPERILKGKGYIKGDDVLVNEPFDFTYKNFLSLTDQHAILRSIIFPESVPPSKRFGVGEDDRKFVLKYMSQLPEETTYPPYYKDTTYYDAYSKFLLFGNDHDQIPSGLRIFNKIGDAYGYMIDNAYVVDFDHNVEFMLSAVINCNTDGIYNDEKYDYENIGYPFMKNIGQAVYHYELKRNRMNKPDLSEFKFQYDR